jgi:hypothetical protein
VFAIKRLPFTSWLGAWQFAANGGQIPFCAEAGIRDHG